MGRKMEPALGIAWKAMGSTTHRAAHTAVKTSFLTGVKVVIKGTSFCFLPLYQQKEGI
jgi:hypothetical protein